jgi:hypothetical protein
LNQLPIRPIACASSMPGARASAKDRKRTPVQRLASQIPKAPPTIDPKMALPPFQIAMAFT